MTKERREKMSSERNTANINHRLNDQLQTTKERQEKLSTKRSTANINSEVTRLHMCQGTLKEPVKDMFRSDAFGFQSILASAGFLRVLRFSLLHLKLDFLNKSVSKHFMEASLKFNAFALLGFAWFPPNVINK